MADAPQLPNDFDNCDVLDSLIDFLLAKLDNEFTFNEMRKLKRDEPQNNEGHKSRLPPYNRCILQQKLRGGNPAHYLNWWFPVHIRLESIAQQLSA